PEAIRSGKIDAFCSGMADDASRGKHMLFANPMSYWSFDIIVRADDKRFPAGKTINAAVMNEAVYPAAYTKGEVVETVITNEFPLVKGVPLPVLGTPADNLLHVMTNKTDFAVMPNIIYQSFNKENPGKLRYLKTKPSLRVYGNVIAVGMDDLKLQQLLN